MAHVLLRPSHVPRNAGLSLQTASSYPASDPLPPPETTVHPGALAIPMASFAWFILAVWIGFGRAETSLVLAAVTFLGIMYFGLLVGFGRDRRRGPTRQRSFREFLDGDVEIGTERMTGRDAFQQLAIFPITLATGGSCIIAAAVWARNA